MFKNVFLAGLICVGSLSIVSASALYFPPNANGMSGTFGYAASGSDISAFNWGADFTYAGKFNISAGLIPNKTSLFMSSKQMHPSSRPPTILSETQKPNPSLLA